MNLFNNQNLTLQTNHKLTYTGRLLNFKSFTSFSYRIILIKCLIDRSFKICNNWKSFHNYIENIKPNLIKNAYSPLLINKVIKKYLTFITLNYHRSATFHTISRINFRNLVKSFVKKILTLSLFLVHSILNIVFNIKTQYLMI